MANFSLAHTQSTLTTTYKTSGELAAASAAASGVEIRRGKVFEFDFGQTGVPNATDCPVQWDVSRITAIGTRTALVPSPLDGADAVTNAQAGVNDTVEPTVAAAGSGLSLFNLGINQRAAYRWIAAPGKELVWPATASNGFAIRALSPNYASSVAGSIIFEEQ
jgi:hypothetical protein